MRFIMNANLDNAAFRDAEDEFDPAELGSILHRVAKQVEDGCREGSVFDTNGNRVGGWKIEGGE